MFREIGTRERITDTDGRTARKDYLLNELFNCRIGSERYNQIKHELDALNAQQTKVFNPDARI